MVQKPLFDGGDRVHPVDAIIINEFVERWNELPNVTPIRRLNADRRRKLLVRLRDKGWDWRTAFERIPTIGFFCRNERGWRPNIEYILRPNSVDRILEGYYEDAEKPKPKRLKRLGDQ
jgi:hypothetical protein